MRDHRKLEVFRLSDEFVIAVYSLTKNFPREEMFGLQSQIRRAAVSVPANIVEGCGRQTNRDFSHFLATALGSAREALYLIELAGKLGFLEKKSTISMTTLGSRCAGALTGLIKSIEKFSSDASSIKSKIKTQK